MTEVADKDHPPSRPATATAASGGAVAAPARLSPAALPGHRSAVARIQSAYKAIPAGQPVRLAKATSNLFRFRGDTAGPAPGRVGVRPGAEVDPAARTAVVGGMTTYEDLVAATLPHGLMPLVVPQLKTITLGGAVSGLGIESTSLRSGMPHESVLEMEILTGDGRVVTAAPGGEHDALYRGFPNSYGTLGYALSLTIELEPVTPYVQLRHFRFASPEELHGGSGRDRRRRQLRGAPGRLRRRHDVQPGRAVPDGRRRSASVAPWRSDYTGSRSTTGRSAGRSEDFLTIRDYLWRGTPTGSGARGRSASSSH